MEPTLEEGQLPEIWPPEIQSGSAKSFAYNPAYEWPGESVDAYAGPAESRFEGYSEGEPSSSLKPGQPIFRLVAEHSSVIFSKQDKKEKKKVAMIDSYHEVQLGRDLQVTGSVTPRIRLKEMEVSKLHATVYWDGARKEWNVVDMGSKHGTFLFHGHTPNSLGMTVPEKDVGVRLSQPRAASVPWRLRHADRLTIGSTTFAVHIHDNQRPCQECTVSGKGELPLFPTTEKVVQKRTREMAEMDSDQPLAATLEIRNPKKALSMLKRSLLTRHTVGTSSSPSTEYNDRAARRRMMYPTSRPDSPGVASLVKATPTVSVEPVSQPPTPLPISNVGHRLLMRQGWTPGTGLGLDNDNLVEPLEVKTTQNRVGLGMKLCRNEHEKFNRPQR